MRALQFEEPILSACTIPSSTKDCSTSLTVCDTFSPAGQQVSDYAKKKDITDSFHFWPKLFEFLELKRQ